MDRETQILTAVLVIAVAMFILAVIIRKREEKKSWQQLRAEREAREARIRAREEENADRVARGLRPKGETWTLAFIYVGLLIMFFGFMKGCFKS